jgi:hypothetical protein
VRSWWALTRRCQFNQLLGGEYEEHHCGLVAAATVAVLAASPKPLTAEEAGGCVCVGGCEGLAYYNPCPNGMCSWFCSVKPGQT